jgi:hypothetical protein
MAWRLSSIIRIDLRLKFAEESMLSTSFYFTRYPQVKRINDVGDPHSALHLMEEAISQSRLCSSDL